MPRSTNAMPARRSRWGGWRTGFPSGWDMAGPSKVGVLRRRLCVAPMNDAEHHRNKEKCGDGGEEKAADHGTAERRILLATIAQAEGHGQHSDDHCEGRHQHRSQPDETGLESSLRRIPDLVELLTRETDHQH